MTSWRHNAAICRLSFDSPVIRSCICDIASCIPMQSFPFVFPPPDAGLSETESRIASHCLQHLSGQLSFMIEEKFRSFGDQLIVRVEQQLGVCVEKAIDRSIQRLQQGSRSSRDSPIESSGSGASGYVGADEENGVWMCPFCDFPCKDEHSFDEHLKLLLGKVSADVPVYRKVVRRSDSRKRHCCVFDANDAQHRALISPWQQHDEMSDWAKCMNFITLLRQCLTPGARAVFVAGGTGHLSQVRDFIEACRRGELPAGRD